MDTKVSYAGILRRVSACAIDGVLWMIIALVSLLFLNYDVDDISTHRIILMATLLITYIVFNILTITKYGCTPGRLLCGVRIKDANTFKNVTLMQATIRYIFREGIWVIYNFLSYLLPGYVSGCLFIILTLVLMFAIFDQRKQTFYDKIAKTVVIDYKPSDIFLYRQCMDKNVNYSKMTRRILAFIVDCILFIAIPFALMAVGFSLTHVIQGIMGAIIVITTIVFSLFLMIPCIFHIFMLVKFGGTLGHLLFSMRVRDKDTLEQITLIQAIKRTIAFFIIYCISLYNPILLLAILILVLVCAVDDEHKQAFHDKIANTVVIDYKPS